MKMDMYDHRINEHDGDLAYLGEATLNTTGSPSTSYSTGSGKFAFTFNELGDLVPEFSSTNSRKPQSPARHSQKKPDDRGSVYTCTNRNFIAQPGEVTHINVDASSQEDVTSNNMSSRSFIMRRFLPAAQAMATDVRSSTSSSYLPADHRLARNSETVTYAAEAPPLPLRCKSRFAFEAKQDLQSCVGNGDELRASGFAVKLGRMTMKHLRYGFRLNSIGKSSRQTKSTARIEAKAGLTGDSDDSEEEHPENVDPADMNLEVQSNLELKRAAQKYNSPGTGVYRKAASTPLNNKGFLGMPKTTALNGQMDRSRQVDRLGTRLDDLNSRTDDVDRIPSQIYEQEEIFEGSSRGPSATSSSSADSPKARWVGNVPIMPLPTPKSPTVSWLGATIPGSRIVERRKSFKKPIGRYRSIRPQTMEE